MRKVQRFAIDGTQYEFMQLGAVEGIELFHDLRKLAIPVLREVIQGGLLDGKVDLEKLDAESTAKIASVVFGLFECLPKALERDLRAAFARSCKSSSAFRGGSASASLSWTSAVTFALRCDCFRLLKLTMRRKLVKSKLLRTRDSWPSLV